MFFLELQHSLMLISQRNKGATVAAEVAYLDSAMLLWSQVGHLHDWSEQWQVQVSKGGGGGGEPPRWIAPVSELGIIAWAWCLTRIGSKVRLIWAFWITMSAQQSCCNRMRGDGRNQKSFLNKCIIQLISDVSHNQTMIIGKGSMVDSTNSDITIFLQIIASTVIYSQSPSN
jgi:hypothetical protein